MLKCTTLLLETKAAQGMAAVRASTPHDSNQSFCGFARCMALPDTYIRFLELSYAGLMLSAGGMEGRIDTKNISKAENLGARSVCHRMRVVFFRSASIVYVV